jgi:transposase-like protein
MEVTKKAREAAAADAARRPDIDPAIIEQLMKGYERPEDLTGPGGILEQLTKRLYERVLQGEMSHSLGYEKGQAPKRAEARAAYKPPQRHEQKDAPQ